jgi:hypothetical protein
MTTLESIQRTYDGTELVRHHRILNHTTLQDTIAGYNRDNDAVYSHDGTMATLLLAATYIVFKVEECS